MKAVGHVDRQVDITGAAQTTKMTIRADPRMFKNLLGSIYSEKEKTVVRELMANAMDSHVKAECPERPIEVHLPTALESNFIVRDYGTGMSHEFIMREYADIGFSSKAGDNSQTGMFGVGSKSPMAITDTFVVKAYDDDGIRTYMVVIPADEHPEINFTFQVKNPDEVYERGVEIIVPVDNSKRHAVLEGLASQHFCWFDKPVKFFGALDEIKHRFYTTIAKINDGLYLATPAVVSNARSGPQWNVYVRQGAAVYPLVESQVDDYIDGHHMALIKSLCTNGRHVLIDLPLGTANVTLAREAIQYDTTTSKNIGRAINACFVGFSKTLADTVGDAKDYPLATERIAAKFFQNDEDRGRLMSQRLAGQLVRMASATINANYKKWHDALPDVPEMEHDFSDGLKVVPKPTGKMIRPPYHTPSHEITMRSGDFPEGKVLLHKGHMFNNYNDVIEIKTGGTDNSLDFSWPNVIFVIPSHLKEWKQKITDYAKEKYKDEALPHDANLGIPVQVIRCALRNVDNVKIALAKFQVKTEVVTIDMLPGLPEDVEKIKRNFSKTSVYPWNKTGWSETKLEPDYTQPAYYVTRVGIAHDVWLTHPTKVYDGAQQRRNKCTNDELSIAVREARKLHFIDETTPIYRVTENQSKRIADTCPAWLHLPTTLFECMEKNVVVNAKMSIGKSDLGSSYDNFLTRMINNARSASRPYNAREADYYFFLRYLCDLDPMIELVASVRLAIIQQAQAFRGHDGESQLDNVLYGYGKRSDAEAIAKYSKLQTALDRRYQYMIRMIDDHHSTKWMPHAKMYLDSAIKTWQSEPCPINLSDYAELDVFKTAFHDMMAALDKTVKPLDGDNRSAVHRILFGDTNDRLAAG